MGPLWAWVVLWVLSAYGLVILLRRAMMRSAGEPVPVLVATPQAVEPSPVVPDPELRDLEASGESVAIEPAELAPLEAPPDPMPTPDSPELGASAEPAFALDDLPASHDAGGQEEESQPEDARGQEPEAGEPEFSEPVFEQSEESEPIVYRAIELESLTLGLQSSEIQGLYGPPGHMSKVGEDGEQWRYPLSATDDRGQGLEGVLVLEFQRGRLVRKALEQAEAER